MQVLCNNLQPSEFIGYQIDLWRDIAADMGLTEDVDWSFTCMDWDVMIDDLIHPQGNCTFAAAGKIEAFVCCANGWCGTCPSSWRISAGSVGCACCINCCCSCSYVIMVLAYQHTATRRTSKQAATINISERYAVQRTQRCMCTWQLVVVMPAQAGGMLPPN